MLKGGFPTSLQDVFLRVQKREKALFIFLCAIGKIIDLYKLAQFILHLDPRKWSLILKRVFQGEASYLRRAGMGVFLIFV